MKVTPQAIPDVLVIEPARHGDARGFLSEVWKRGALSAAGLKAEFVQDNQPISRHAGALRDGGGLGCPLAAGLGAARSFGGPSPVVHPIATGDHPTRQDGRARVMRDLRARG